MSENDRSNQEMLFVAGGVALMVFGAGLIMACPAIRKTLLAGLSSAAGGAEGEAGLPVSAILPDVERYLRIRSM